MREVVQREEMDSALRAGLWNVLSVEAWKVWPADSRHALTPKQQSFIWVVWHSHFKEPIDTAPSRWRDVVATFRTYFFSAAWYEAYDFVEFIAANHPVETSVIGIRKMTNVVLEREKAAYRFVGGRIMETTSTDEVEAIDDALAAAKIVPTARTHLESALSKLADRAAPDYRNSIKESISAVEAIVNAVNGSPGTLGAALKRLGVDAHPALAEAFSKLYGYTSDADGIRHALLSESKLEYEDAKFMLVACSAFVTYVLAKGARSGISF